MANQTYRFFSSNKSIIITKSKIFIPSLFFLGFLLALIFDIDIDLQKFMIRAICNSKTFSNNASNTVEAFILILYQLYSEFCFIFTAFVAIHSIIPQIVLICVTAAKGYQQHFIFKAIFTSVCYNSLLSKIIISAYEISLTVTFIYYIIALSNTLRDSATDTNEFSILISSQTRTRLFLTITVCGSMIILNILKNLLLYIALLF